MKAISSSKSIVLALAMCFTLAGCSTLQSAYTSTVDTVSGWFKSEDPKGKK